MKKRASLSSLHILCRCVVRSSHLFCLLSPRFPLYHTPFCSASYDSTVRLWDPSLASNASSSSSAGAGSRACKGVLSKHSAMVYALAWSPDGSLLASGASDKAVHIWSARDGSLVRSYTTGASGVFDVSFSADGTEVAAACANGTVTVLNLRR